MPQRDVLLEGLATYRVTRLITTDEITRPAREALVKRLESRGHHKLTYLLQCPYCVSVWVGAAFVIAPRVLGRAWLPVRDALSASAIVSLIAEAEEIARAD
ncbi:MAG TPA: DUF1360 domain-containing protein [Gaiellaceae bacterium]|nr:DUF1360 domain-containing protein [Gaiellaceae bacterium]